MAMHVGTLRIMLHLHNTFSLKDKRQIIRSLLERTRQKFNVSFSEVGELDNWRKAELGLAFVSNDARFVNETLDKALNLLESNPEYEIIDTESEIS